MVSLKSKSSLISKINFWDGVPLYFLVILLFIVIRLEPNALSYNGFNLLLSAAVPLAFAAMAQMFIMAAGDIDLGLGTFVGLVNVITAIVLIHHILYALLIYAGMILAYVLLGLLVHNRQLPSIVVTLGASFVWLGIAIIILPSPAGEVPVYIINFFNWSPPIIPGPVIYLILIGLIGNFVLMRTRYGAVLRGSGSNADAIGRAGWSVAKTKAILYGFAGLFGILSGLSLSAITTSGDANNGASYVLLSIMAVIIGGGEFSGGLVAPAGAVAGAAVVVLIGTVLTFLNVSSDYQIGAQGLILIATLAIRAVRRFVTGRVKVK